LPREEMCQEFVNKVQFITAGNAREVLDYIKFRPLL
jgi:hypothetical protein